MLSRYLFCILQIFQLTAADKKQSYHLWSQTLAHFTSLNLPQEPDEPFSPLCCEPCIWIFQPGKHSVCLVRCFVLKLTESREGSTEAAGRSWLWSSQSQQYLKPDKSTDWTLHVLCWFDGDHARGKIWPKTSSHSTVTLTKLTGKDILDPEWSITLLCSSWQADLLQCVNNIYLRQVTSAVCHTVR